MQLKRLCPVLLLALLAYAFPAHALRTIEIQADTIESGAGKARDVRMTWQIGPDSQVRVPQGRNPQSHSARTAPSLKLAGKFLPENENSWQVFRLSCGQFDLPRGNGQWRCQDGQLKTDRMDIPFQATVIRHPVHQQEILGAEINLENAHFNNSDGTHAAEKFTATLNLNASRTSSHAYSHPDNQWNWVADIDWKGGELYWQPYYLTGGGHRLHAEGSLDRQALRVRQSNIRLNNIGQLSGSGELRLADKQLLSAKLTAENLNLAQAYPVLFKPVLVDTSFDNLDVEGKADLSLEMDDAAVRSFHLALHEVDVEDKNGKFALYKLNADIPWDYDQAHQIGLKYQGGHVFKIPLAQSTWQAQVNRYAVTAPEIKVNILDGALVLSDVSAALLSGNWHWHLRANLTPLDMPGLSSALGWPRMEGKVAAAIPLVTYSNGLLTTDGALGFNLFNGSIRMSNLEMHDPMGSTPKLNADLEMRNLDLGALTRTFSFGAIEGKLDGSIANLELSNWQPVQFDASFFSSPGRYPRKISQRAVENISALGGAGAAAAIQRSFLRFFHEFNYQKLGLSCRLRNDICEMGGIDTTPQGFVIVKGSGVPAITVLGYNQRVSWGELLSRIQRVTENNVKPVIQ